MKKQNKNSAQLQITLVISYIIISSFLGSLLGLIFLLVAPSSVRDGNAGAGLANLGFLLLPFAILTYGAIIGGIVGFVPGLFLRNKARLKKTIIVLAAAALLFGPLVTRIILERGFSIQVSDSEEAGLPSNGRVKVDSFNPDGVCAAQLPECGYCIGDREGKGCYIKIGGQDGLVKAEDYFHYDESSNTARCLALIPGCGYCPGVTVGESCYIEPDAATKQSR